MNSSSKHDSHHTLSGETKSYQGIFIPYTGRPQEITVNLESGGIRQKLNCEYSDHVTLWAKDYKLCLFCDDYGASKNLPKNPMTTRLISCLSGMVYDEPIRGNIVLLDDEKELTIKDLSLLMKTSIGAPSIKKVVNCLLADFRQLVESRKKPHDSRRNTEIFSLKSVSNPCRIQIVCREVTGKEAMSQFKKDFQRACYLEEDSELVDIDDWDLIVVQVKNLHRIKLDLEKSLIQNIEVMIDEKEAVLRDESIVNNEDSRSVFCKLLLAAREVKAAGYQFENEDIQGLTTSVDEIRNQFWND
ncbi:12776_t:CDS:1 [Acaulospora colombiana]|uniref:12776_t:CDS:1 n=1 Tax=Acaulospora colombiana TaxID=27376 RepID=A0ACA9LZP8_9GLOM|nr:12776_t:CDS:1 [Acaulospora colombiana]